MNRISFVLIALLAVPACGDDSGPAASDARRVDAPNPIDAPENCVAPANYGPLTITDMDQGATGGDTTAVNSTGALTMANYEWAAVIANNTPQVALLIVDFWEGYGVFTAGVTADTFEITGDELSVADCGLCTFLLSDLVIQNGMIMSANEQYFQTGGSITFTSVPMGNHRPAVADGGFVADGPVAPDGGWGALTGSIMNMTFGEMDMNGDIMPGGCQTGIMSANINDPLVDRIAPPGKRVKDGKYGHHRITGLFFRGGGGDGPMISK